jgi:hypothetical protein
MELRNIKIKELSTYIDSSQYRNSKTIAITRLRAVSQQNNPNADPDDVALILADNPEGELIGFIGIMPCGFYQKDTYHRIYTNSGWWVDPINGRNAAMPLLFSMLELYGTALFFADLTPRTTEILKKTGLFEFPAPIKGEKYFLRFPLQRLFKRKNVSFLFQKIFDGISRMHLFLREKRIKLPVNVFVEEVNEANDEINQLIHSVKKETPYFREKTELNWILKYPWLRVCREGLDEEAEKYHFSTIAKDFSNHFFKIFKDKELIAFVFLTLRNGDVKVPYYYCKPDDVKHVAMFIFHFLMDKKAVSFVTWQKPLLDCIRQNRMPFLFRKTIIKQEAYSKELAEIFSDAFSLSDGDGDMAFT